MLFHTEGIVLQTIKYGDNSIIAKVFTQKSGLQSYLIKGVGSKKTSLKMNYFQPLRMLEMVTYQKENAKLNIIKEVKPIAIQNGIYNDVHKTSICLFLAEILQKTLKETDVEIDLYDFLKHKIELLDRMEPLNMNFHLCFLWELTSYLGFEPLNNYSNEKIIFSHRDGCFIESNHISTTDLNFFVGNKMSATLSELLSNENFLCNNLARKELLEIGLRYYQIHFPNFTTVKSLEVLKELFQ